ncbi:MAG TPA: hypothetical protein VKA60_27595 [Blastocatellia bacterium]|nr:hypothetical protein [Blastocatellia bacterium]
MDNPETLDPLGDALESVKREQLGGDSAPPAESGDAFEPPAEPEQKQKPGRKPDPNSRRSRREARRREAAAAASGKVEGPPPPVDTVRVEYPPISPKAVADSLRQLDEQISRAIGTEPLTEDELLEGGGVFAPILDHYMPLLAQEGGLWVPAATFVVMAYGPRLWEAIDRMQRRKAGLPPAPAKEARAANGEGDFRPSSLPAGS